jgi:hypothetical protein
VHTRVTGEADQLPDDDLTRRTHDLGAGLGQFGRPGGPQARTLFAGAVSGSATRGSRERQRGVLLESTESGQVITGSAVGRSVRVTGDEEGACRHLTGDQYLTPARRQTECGGRGGGTGPVGNSVAARRDPVTGAKVAVSQTWRGQQISGSNVEHDPRVTGDEPGSCAVLTGTPYQGATTVHGWCDPQHADAAEARLARAASPVGVTGDVPLQGISGLGRGSDRAITGTPYTAGATAAGADAAGDIGTIDDRFSVRSPMRSAQLRRTAGLSSSGTTAAQAEERITGAFAVGQGKVTGNLEFLFRPRIVDAPDEKPAHGRLTGEGSRAGRAVTGDAWADHHRVTGTEGRWAAGRSPTERAGKANSIAGVGPFQKLGRHDEPRQIVTGMVGWSSKSAAKVTLSGGAQG